MWNYKQHKDIPGLASETSSCIIDSHGFATMSIRVKCYLNEIIYGSDVVS